MHEIRIHQLLKHPNIVAFETYFEGGENMYIVLERCKEKTLKDLLFIRKRLTEVEVRYYLSQLISGIKYLHNKRIVHRNLNPSNIFFNNDNHIKIGDFGLAERIAFKGQCKRSICGTPCYIAPEVMYGNNGHSFEVDIWSLGVIVYTMLVGKLPFEPYRKKISARDVYVDLCKFPVDCNISSEAKELVSKMLDLFPEYRATLYEIEEHPFMTDNGNIPAKFPDSTLDREPSKLFLALASLTDEEQKELKAKKTKTNLRINFRLLQITYLKDVTMSRVVEAGREVLRGRVWVKQWIKHTNCLGYMLTTGAVGVHFKGESKVQSAYKSE
jgi:serine/threonine protein kinase